MAWTTVECADCGDEYQVQLYGKIRDRQWKIDNWRGFCDSCKKKFRDESTRKAIADAKDMGLPNLSGTEKQIAWAETIRVDILNKSMEFINRQEDETLKSKYGDAFQQLCSIAESRFWIDNRNVDIVYILDEATRAVETPEKAAQKGLELDASIEATVRPPSPLTETIAEIRIQQDKIQIEFPERVEIFRLLVRGLGYIWNRSCWERKITLRSGPIDSRAAEAGNKILSAGFCVRIYDDSIRQKAIGGVYEPECGRWIMARTSGKYNGWFVVWWKRGEDFYRQSKQLSGSRYDKPNVIVPSEQFEEALDFAEIHGFRLSDGALELMEKARAAKEATLVISVESKETEVSELPERPELGTPKNVEIDNEFKDDPA